MINSVLQELGYFYKDQNLPEDKQSMLRKIISNLTNLINYAIKSIQEDAIKIGSGFLNQSLKLATLVTTGIKLTLMKVEKFITYISQINLNIIIGYQTNIHQVVNHYKVCSHCACQEKIIF